MFIFDFYPLRSIRFAPVYVNRVLAHREKHLKSAIIKEIFGLAVPHVRETVNVKQLGLVEFFLEVVFPASLPVCQCT